MQINRSPSKEVRKAYYERNKEKIAEVDKCILLCANCHRLVHKKDTDVQ